MSSAIPRGNNDIQANAFLMRLDLAAQYYLVEHKCKIEKVIERLF